MMLVKEEFVGCEKYVRAMKLGGSDAIVMWVAMKCHASKHPSAEGFIADEDIDDLAGAPRRHRKALQALVECGRLLPGGQRGHGLVDPVQGGWQLHDYLDHATSPEEEELRRTRARVKKARQREEKRRELEQLRGACPGDMSRGQQGDSPGDTRGTVSGTALAGARPPACVGARDPSPPLPTPKLKSLPAPLRRIHSDPRAQARETTPLAPIIHPEWRQFAEEIGVDIDELVARCKGHPGSITKALMDAAAAREQPKEATA